MAFETILVDVTGGILTITLNRPDRMNAFTTTMMHEMVAAFDQADGDDAVRAVIVTGSGGRSVPVPISARAARHSTIRVAPITSTAARRSAPMAASICRIPARATPAGGWCCASSIAASR
ncbi:MAG: enoyl-CoA hydratase [Sphingomonas bacterium]|nr:enoyl-CoA hydratase [Sphingomonas bacterium]